MNDSDNQKDIVREIGFSLLSEGKTIKVRADGYSMYPAIKPGSQLLIEPISVKGNPVPGEIIAIKREQGLVVHRLVRVVSKGGITSYIARGDSNALEDAPVMIGRIAGRIVGAETTGENPVPADISINTKPNYYLNRLKVIVIVLLKKIKKVIN